MTVLGDVLKDSPRLFQESVLFAMEMMKLGVLTADPFDPVQDRPFPEGKLEGEISHLSFAFFREPLLSN